MGRLRCVSVISVSIGINCRSQWPRGLRRRSAAAHLLRLWVRIPLRAWMSVCCECCVLSGRGFCNELITRPEEFYRLWCVDVCDLEKITLVNEDAGQDPLRGYRAKRKKIGINSKFIIRENALSKTRKAFPENLSLSLFQKCQTVWNPPTF